MTNCGRLGRWERLLRPMRGDGDPVELIPRSDRVLIRGFCAPVVLFDPTIFPGTDAMARTLFLRYRVGLVLLLLAIAVPAVWYPIGCSSPPPATATESSPVIRVRLLAGVDQATIGCAIPPNYRVARKAPATLNSPKNAVFTLAIGADGWQAGNARLGGAPTDPAGTALPLEIEPAELGTVTINGIAYRGRFRFVPVGGNKFDVINDVDVDSYLASVVSREMLPGWHEEAYRAQAIIARTYALYEKQTTGAEKQWDVYADTRSQVYGGIPAETAGSLAAVADTAGIVVAAADAEGRVKIFKAYFSACCGGVSQSGADAFSESYVPALSDQNVYAACKASPRFNWGPIDIPKTELTRRFVLFGQKRNRPEATMATIARVDIQQQNRWGRPIRFLVIDTRGNRFSLSGEEFRWAVNTGAPESSVLYSSFVKVISDSDKIRFVEGHGWGHGVGMCQWCAEKRAEDGLGHEHIILAAYPTAVLVRAY